MLSCVEIWTTLLMPPIPLIPDYLYFTQQFAPGSSLEVLITSADSRIRVVNGDELVHKFKGNFSFSSHCKL
jgi:hypothetical protein